MTDTLSLFDVDAPRARHSDPKTAKNAAVRMAKSSPKLEAQILELLARYRGLNKDEVCQHLDIDPRRWPSVASCLTRLRNAGKLEWRGEPRGHQNVWYLAERPVDVAGDVL